MIHPGLGVKIYLATKTVDFRKGHNGLAALVQNHLRQNPFDGAVYVFRAKRADRVKIIYWEFAPVHEVTNCPVDSLRGERAEPSGLVMAYKCLEKFNFNWPAIKDGVMRLDPVQFEALLGGLQWRQLHALNVSAPAAAN